MPVPPVKEESRAFFRAIGKRIAVLRKEQGMTQAELSRALGVSQQSVFAYELGDRRVSVHMLIKLAKEFDVPVAELMGMPKVASPKKRRLSSAARRHAERLQKLNKIEQRFVNRIIETLLARNAKRTEASADLHVQPDPTPRFVRCVTGVYRCGAITRAPADVADASGDYHIAWRSEESHHAYPQSGQADHPC